MTTIAGLGKRFDRLEELFSSSTSALAFTSYAPPSKRTTDQSEFVLNFEKTPVPTQANPIPQRKKGVRVSSHVHKMVSDPRFPKTTTPISDREDIKIVDTTPFDSGPIV